MKKINFFLIGFISLFYFSTSYSADYYNVGVNSLQCINEYSNNRVVENKLESNLFVPTKTRSEWYKFISYKPEDVNIYKTSWSSGNWSSCDANPSWSNWGSRSNCTVSCGGGTQSRSRSCNNTSGTKSRDVTCDLLGDTRSVSDSCCTGTKPGTTQDCTKSCDGISRQTISCNTQSCWSCGDPIRYGGNTYNTKIGLDGKCWTTSFMNHNPTTSYRACYGGDSSNCNSTYGGLYNYNAALTLCGKLGDGWILPTKSHFDNLKALGAGSYNTNKFSGIVNSLPGYKVKYYYKNQDIAHIWTSTSTASSSAVSLGVMKSSANLYSGTTKLVYYNSVLCVKNN